MKVKLLKKIRKRCTWRFDGDCMIMFDHKAQTVGEYTDVRVSTVVSTFAYMFLGAYGQAFYERRRNERSAKREYLRRCKNLGITP